MALKPQQAIPINLPVSYFPEGSTTVFVEIWLHTDLDILSKECKLHKSKPKGHIHQYVRENQSKIQNSMNLFPWHGKTKFHKSWKF